MKIEGEITKLVKTLESNIKEMERSLAAGEKIYTESDMTAETNKLLDITKPVVYNYNERFRFKRKN